MRVITKPAHDTVAAIKITEARRLQQDFNPARFGDLDRGECIVRRFGDDAHYMQMGPPPVGRGTAATIIKQSKRHYSRAAR